LGITAVAADLPKARAIAYETAENIDWPEGFYRRDIAWRAL
jgi:phosphoribosylamine--glycine ligase